jgi:hypothetical protein
VLAFFALVATAMAAPEDSHDAGSPDATPLPSAESPPPHNPLEARVSALEAELQKMQQDALLREAEALIGAAAPPPPPQGGGRAAFNALNPGITAFGDVVGQVGVVDGALMNGSTMFLRSLELDLRAAVDPFATANAVLAFEQEAPPLDGGPSEGFGAEPEEAYIDLVALPWRLSGRIGKFKQPFGVANRMHPHDLPWTDTPAALGALGEEGLNDVGGTLTKIVPFGPVALTLTGGVGSGEPFDEDGTSPLPSGIGRAELFVQAGDVAVVAGGSAVTSPGTDAAAYGGDLMLRWRKNERRSAVLIAELLQAKGGDPTAYAALQLQPARGLYVGFREDVTPDGLTHNAYISKYTSEFLRFRAGGGYAPSTGQFTGLAQLTFVWGSHPVEPWWVNR